jgi:site-specific DNA-methyltransferase (adenine-specific)
LSASKATSPQSSGGSSANDALLEFGCDEPIEPALVPGLIHVRVPINSQTVPKKSKRADVALYRKPLCDAVSSSGDLDAETIAVRPFVLREDGAIISGNGTSQNGTAPGPHLAHHDAANALWIYQGNCLELLDAIGAKYPEGRFDCIFADPPYFLSNGGITCHAGRMVRVDKGDWDKSRGPELNHEFNLEWLKRCQRVLKPNGTIWVSGTQHVIFSIGYAMQQLGFKILNDIAWEKPNPPPNLSCRYFTHSTETILWAARDERSKHRFNYADMRKANGGKQMKTVWRMAAPAGDEKRFGKHPTQKPVALIERCLLAATSEGDLVLDPFLGGGTTAVACLRSKRGCVGIELDEAHTELAIQRAKDQIEKKNGELFR